MTSEPCWTTFYLVEWTPEGDAPKETPNNEIAQERTVEEKVLFVERTERICTLTLNRPEKRNALSPLLLRELTDVLRRLTEEDEVRCVVIRGAGEKAFSAGFDISDLPISAGTEETDPVRAESPLDQGMQARHRFSLPGHRHASTDLPTGQGVNWP